MEENYYKVSSTEIDVLKEIGTIGSGRAATALADLLGIRVNIRVPEVRLVPLENIDKLLGNPEEVLFVIDIELKGDVRGRIIFLIAPTEAGKMGSVLLGKPPHEINWDDLFFQSTLNEIANILVGSYMNALSDMTGLTILYDVPSIVLDMVSAVLDFIFIKIAKESEKALFIKTDLNVEDREFRGFFFFFPTMDTLKKIFKALKISD